MSELYLCKKCLKIYPLWIDAITCCPAVEVVEESRSAMVLREMLIKRTGKQWISKRKSSDIFSFSFTDKIDDSSFIESVGVSVDMEAHILDFFLKVEKMDVAVQYIMALSGFYTEKWLKEHNYTGVYKYQNKAKDGI